MFAFTKLFIFVQILFLQTYVNCEDICGTNIKLKGEDRAKNKILQSDPSSNCINYENIIKSEKDKEDIVNKINSRRNYVASGQIRSLPAAENIIKLEWSNKLAVSAQRWVHQCVSNDHMDPCRDLQNTTVGQNIATLYGEAPQLKPSTLVDLWYMELLNINTAKIFNYEPSSKSGLNHYDYFTQLVWSDSKLVGCGAARYQEISQNSNKNRTLYRLVCNFMPSGNIEGRHIYREGVPCINCPRNRKCDSVYTSLCESEQEEIIDKNIIQTNFNENVSEPNRLSDTTKFTSNGSGKEDSDESFDIFSDLFALDINTTTPQTEITRLCKDVIAVDEFMDILRKKLSTDNVLKELLFSTKSQSDVQYSDAKIDAIVSKIYRTKTIATTTKPTDSDIVNSTLLVDLVEAVIFRNRDQITSNDDTPLISTSDVEGKTVVMQAELGEVKQNVEFTGHYFFPEEEDREEEQSETTELYYDSPLPISEIVLEIEQLKRNKDAKDFIDEILDFDTEGSTLNHVATLAPHSSKESEINPWTLMNNLKEESKKNKRNIPTINTHNAFQYRKKSMNGDSYILISYNELLKYLAEDLKKLKLNEKFHCAHNSALNCNFVISFYEVFYFSLFYSKLVVI